MAIMCTLSVCKAQEGMCGHEKAMLSVVLLAAMGLGTYFLIGCPYQCSPVRRFDDQNGFTRISTISIGLSSLHNLHISLSPPPFGLIVLFVSRSLTEAISCTSLGRS